KEIYLIRDLIQRLDQKPFDLQAWKTNAMMILGRIFGENSRKVELIRAIQPDYSSWSLRDTSGRISQTDECRKMAHEVLDAVIAELQAFGPPFKAQDDANLNLQAIENFVTVRQSKELAKIIGSDQSPEEKEAQMSEILGGLDQVDLLAMVVKMLNA
ncbi:MAG: hypothetical protein PHX54_03255, partial [Lentimicrobiaceae bacterium]|nr:hypothetical protein [Lentimicrobiaceae bacterium]